MTLNEVVEHMNSEDIIEKALASKAWPFLEAEKIVKRIKGKTPEKGYVLFETGYGPSGLPHIGTFGEVVRTTMVRQAFEVLAPDIPTKLFCISDDLDGLRKVPDNLPNQDMIIQHLNKPLTAIPDPFGTHASFGAHMNNRLCEFLDRYEFDYEFKSATENYNSGVYDEKLLAVLAHFQKVMDIMLPTLGSERRQTYSPFMPICPETGYVLQVPTLNVDAERGTITYQNSSGVEVETEVTGGKCKLQWKPDWGMRWAALDVDYEMYGKDLLPSAQVSGRICKVIGGRSPEQFMYELFLDEKGEKISKSKGNGLSMNEWLEFAPPVSLAYYMYQNPRKAKRLYFDVIPKTVDEYLSFLIKYKDQTDEEKLKNPAYHMHGDAAPEVSTSLTFALLLNLASACHAEDADILWGFIKKYEPETTPESSPFLSTLADCAVAYYQSFVKPNKVYRQPTDKERAALQKLRDKLETFDDSADSEAIQTEIYSIGKEFEFDPLRDWFKVLYEVLLGQSQGPRFGSFAALFGIKNTQAMIDKALSGELQKVS